MRGSCRGCGTILRGATTAAASTGAGAGGAGCAGAGFATTAGGGAAGEAAGAAGRGLAAAAAASSLRRKSSRAASPGFETCDQSIFGFCPLPRGTILRLRVPAASPLQIDAYTLSFIALERTRMGLLFGYANCRQSVQDLPALDFQFARQIIDSNFTHPPL